VGDLILFFKRPLILVQVAIKVGQGAFQNATLVYQEPKIGDRQAVPSQDRA
jgi:hypothetical protein